MYDELIARLREADEKSMCGECGLNLHTGATKKGVLFAEAADAIEELQKSKQESKQVWIPVAERLPEIGEIVLAYVDDLCLIIRAKIVDAKDYRGERRIDWARVDPDPFFLSCYTITHWMPLPEPPKEG